MVANIASITFSGRLVNVLKINGLASLKNLLWLLQGGRICRGHLVIVVCGEGLGFRKVVCLLLLGNIRFRNSSSLFLFLQNALGCGLILLGLARVEIVFAHVQLRNLLLRSFSWLLFVFCVNVLVRVLVTTLITIQVRNVWYGFLPSFLRWRIFRMLFHYGFQVLFHFLFSSIVEVVVTLWVTLVLVKNVNARCVLWSHWYVLLSYIVWIDLSSVNVIIYMFFMVIGLFLCAFTHHSYELLSKKSHYHYHHGSYDRENWHWNAKPKRCHREQILDNHLIHKNENGRHDKIQD